jgi:hypothetical protein
MRADLYLIKTKDGYGFGKQQFQACTAEKTVIAFVKIIYHERPTQILKACPNISAI